MPISYIEIILIGIGLSMDAFAVSICKGLACPKYKFTHSLIAGAYFGIFQMVMPIIGFFAGTTFAKYVSKIDHWIAFALLGFIGVHMIVSAIREKEEKVSSTFKIGEMLILAVATSIDALAVGVSFSMLGFTTSNIFVACGIIGIITFILSGVGIALGHVFSAKNKKIAEIVGGAILIAIGLKILITDLINGS